MKNTSRERYDLIESKSKYVPSLLDEGHETFLKRVGLNVRYYRLNHDPQLRQSDVAKRIGTTRQNVLAIENGRTETGIQTFAKIAEYLGTHVWVLLYEDRRE